MKYLLHFGYVIAILLYKVVAFLEGHETSIVYLSNITVFDYKSMKNLIVFGDSLSSVHTNFTDMTYTGQNLSNGDNWPIQLAKINHMKLWDFAVTGSVIDDKIISKEKSRSPSINNLTVPIQNFTYLDQYGFFLDKMTKGKIFENAWNSNDTLFAYWIGTNDMLIIDHTKYKKRINETIDSIVDTLFETLEGVYESGGRNFLFLNLQALDEMPNFNDTDKNDIKKSYLRFNDRLYKNSLNFYGLHNDTNVIIYNIKDEFQYIINNYQKYNFLIHNDTYNSLKSQYPDIEDYIWTDNLHATSKANKIFAKDIDFLLTTNGSFSSHGKKLSLILMNVFLVLYILL